jgi:hypothetical protein
MMMRFDGPDANDLTIVITGAYAAHSLDATDLTGRTIDTVNAAWDRICARHTQCTALMMLTEWARLTKLN